MKSELLELVFRQLSDEFESMINKLNIQARDAAFVYVERQTILQELVEAFEAIVQWNRDHAEAQYGDPNKCETWACVVTARASIAKATEYKNA
jgi:hypothetical protein